MYQGRIGELIKQNGRHQGERYGRGERRWERTGVYLGRPRYGWIRWADAMG